MALGDTMLFVSLRVWHHKQGQHIWHKCLLLYKPTSLCSSVVKRKPTRIRPDELEFRARKKELFCMNMDRTTIRSLRTEVFACFLCFGTSWHPSPGDPFGHKKRRTAVVFDSFLSLTLSLLSHL